MAVELEVLAPVVAQPGLPSLRPAAADVSDIASICSRVEREGPVVRGYLFESDKFCRAVRFEILRWFNMFVVSEPPVARHLQDSLKSRGIVEQGTHLRAFEPGDGFVKSLAFFDLDASRRKRHVDPSEFAAAGMRQGVQMIFEQFSVLAELL